MKMVHVGHAALLALVIAAACADPVSNQAASEQVLADRSTSDDDSNDPYLAEYQDEAPSKLQR